MEETKNAPTVTSHPALLQDPPDWLRGSADADLGNVSKRFRLYQKLLGHLGVWNHLEYLTYKLTKSIVDDPRDVMPDCVLKVSTDFDKCLQL